MPKSKKQNFVLYYWLLKKLRGKLLLWYFLTFIYLFFYYQTTSYGLKQLWGYKNANPPFPIFFWQINSRAGLICYLLLAFFVIYLLISVIGEYLRNYSLELCRFHLRKLILTTSQKNSAKTQEHRREILSNFLGEVELFAPIFVQVPHRIYGAILSIIFNFFFLTSLTNDIGSNSFTTIFFLLASLVITIMVFLTYHIQTKINRKENKFRHQENILFEEYLEQQTSSAILNKLITKNFQQTHHSFWKKSFSALSYLIIPGLGILFCFIFSLSQGKNLEIENFVQVFILAGSLQTIFFKVKDVIDNLPEISKGKIYYKSLEKMLKKLENK